MGATVAFVSEYGGRYVGACANTIDTRTEKTIFIEVPKFGNQVNTRDDQVLLINYRIIHSSRGGHFASSSIHFGLFTRLVDVVGMLSEEPRKIGKNTNQAWFVELRSKEPSPGRTARKGDKEQNPYE